MKLRTLFLFGALLGFTPVAHAQLKWEQTALELHPGLNDAEAVGTFKYENVGQKPIRITDVHTSCGCTIASRKKDIAEPGEKGEITATFHIQGRTGVQQKQITVTTDDPQTPTTVLTLKTIVPTLLEVQPTFVYWNADETDKPKVITVKANADYPVTKLDVKSSSPDVTTKVEPGATPKEWKINVTRNTGAHPMPNAIAQLTIAPDYPKEAPKLYYATVRLATPNIAAPNTAARSTPPPAATTAPPAAASPTAQP